MRMRAVTVFVTLVLLLPQLAIAQEIGVKAGVNFASLTPEEDEDPEISRHVGPIAGGWVRIPRSGRWSFQAEGLFSEKGVVFEPVPAAGLDDSLDVRLRYLELPLLARLDFGAAGAGARVFALGGVAPAFELSAHTKTTFEGEELRRNIDDAIYSTDVGLVGALGVEFGRAVIEGRYTHGLRHINTDDNGDEDRIKNRVFSVMFGFRLY
jgi:hypothetical protein